MNLHLQLNPEAENFVNCYLIRRPNVSNALGYAGFPQYNGENLPAILSGTGFDDTVSVWQGAYFYFRNHLHHEIGHLLGLYHINSVATSESLNPTDLDFLCDVYNNPPAYIDGCNNVMGGVTTDDYYFSPLQMGRMHRGLSTDAGINGTGVRYLRHYAYGYSSVPHNITTNETWDFVFKSYNDIIVKKGATLTLKCRLEMVPEAKIVVEQGGKLILDGAIITSARNAGPLHEGLWKGIEVWGTDDKSQTQVDPSSKRYQGIIELKNDAIIENAYIAVQLRNPLTWTNGGGIILMNNSTIRNCSKGVHFASYPNYISISSIKNSKFQTTQKLLGSAKPQTFIDGWSFKGVLISNCIFENTNPNVTQLDQLGKGIYLESARAIISGETTSTFSDYCTENNPNWKPNVFTNLYKGVELVNVGAPQTNGAFASTVTRNIFNNCIFGIECKGMPLIKIEQNKIKMGNNPIYNDYNEGIKYSSNTGFSIQENCIEKIGSNALFFDGIIVANAGGDNNDVYKNKSINMDYAFLSNGKNRTAAPTVGKYKGLQFLCNLNQGSQQYDIAVVNDPNDPNNPMTGIRYYQGGNGSSSNPTAAGNTFTYCNSGNYNLYNSTINSVVYFHNNGFSQTPNCYSWNITPSSSTNNTCASRLSGGGGSSGIVLQNEYQNLNSQYVIMSSIYSNTIDNGNTSSLLDMIVNDTYSDEDELLIELQNLSPNLSEKVILKLIDENKFISNQSLLYLIASNPDIAYNEVILKKLSEKINPFDEWMLDFLRDAGTYTTDRTLIEKRFASIQYEREAKIWEIIRSKVHDSIENVEELNSWLNLIGTPNAKFILMDNYISSGNYVEAENTLNSFIKEDLDESEQLELELTREWINFVKSTLSENKNMHQLEESEIDFLRSFCTDDKVNGRVKTIAQNIVNSYYPESYVQTTIYPSMSKSSQINTTYRILKENTDAYTKNSVKISVYPNPTTDFVKFDFGAKNLIHKITVQTVSGIEILEVAVDKNERYKKMKLDNFTDGIYILHFLSVDGVILKSEKLVVQNK